MTRFVLTSRFILSSSLLPMITCFAFWMIAICEQDFYRCRTSRPEIVVETVNSISSPTDSNKSKIMNLLTNPKKPTLQKAGMMPYDTCRASPSTMRSSAPKATRRPFIQAERPSLFWFSLAHFQWGVPYPCDVQE
jgi:hypothetical protein